MNTEIKAFILILKRLAVKRSVSSFITINPISTKTKNISKSMSPVINNDSIIHIAIKIVIFSDINNFYLPHLVFFL